jgi:hypothetical protein
VPGQRLKVKRRRIPVVAVVYDPVRRTVTLRLKNNALTEGARRAQLTVLDGVIDAVGNVLDGNYDGRVGGAYTVWLAVRRSRILLVPGHESAPA